MTTCIILDFDELFVMFSACPYFISNYGRLDTGFFREDALRLIVPEKPGFFGIYAIALQ